jgi:hypothetical protein
MTFILFCVLLIIFVSVNRFPSNPFQTEAAWLELVRVRSWHFLYLFRTIWRVQTSFWRRKAFSVFIGVRLCWRWVWRNPVVWWVLVCSNLWRVRIPSLWFFPLLWVPTCFVFCWRDVAGKLRRDEYLIWTFQHRCARKSLACYSLISWLSPIVCGQKLTLLCWAVGSLL